MLACIIHADSAGSIWHDDPWPPLAHVGKPTCLFAAPNTAYLERWAKAAGKFKEKQQAAGGSKVRRDRLDR